MKITRVYADGEGDSHFEDLVIELRDAGPIGHLSEPFPAKEVLFRRNDPGYDYDWHPAPRRQFIVLLDGVIELEVSDGERRTLRGGEILLLEDTSGRGHRTRNIEPRERHSVFIALE
jgi:quercetin dioxygenase-like cupin family protein